MRNCLITSLLVVAIVSAMFLTLKAAWMREHNQTWTLLGLHIPPSMAPSMAGVFTVVWMVGVVALLIRGVMRRINGSAAKRTPTAR